MDANLQPLMPEDISDDDLAARARVAPNIVVLHAEENGLIPVSVDVVSAAPEPDLAAADHVVEFSVEAPSGSLILAGCVEYVPTAPRIAVPPGAIRGRAEFRSSDDGESCRVVLWPGANRPLKVLKQNAS